MLTLMIVIFVLGYLAIALEHPIKIDKAASALITGVLVWTVYVISGESPPDTAIADHLRDLELPFVNEKSLLHHLGE